MSLQTLTRKKQPFVTFCRMSASEKVCNFVTLEKNPSSKQESNESALFTTFYVEVDIWIICKKKGTVLSSLIPPCQFCPSSSLCPSSPSVLWTDSVSEFAAFATGNDINYHRNVAKMWRCFFGIYIFQFVWSLCFFFSTVLTANWMLKDFHVS